MDQPAPHPTRAKILIALPACLLAGVILVIVFIFVVWRSIMNIFRHLTGQAAPDPHAKAAVAKAKKRARRAAASFNFAKRRYTRAEAKLAQAQAALEAAQGRTQPAAPADDEPEAEITAPERWWKSPKGRFVIGSGKMLAAYLLKQRQKRK